MFWNESLVLFLHINIFFILAYHQKNDGYSMLRSVHFTACNACCTECNDAS